MHGQYVDSVSEKELKILFSSEFTEGRKFSEFLSKRGSASEFIGGIQVQK